MKQQIQFGITVRIVADAPMFDLKHINKDEMDKRMKKIEESRHIRMSRCYTNITKKYNGYNNYNNYNSFIRDQINSYDNPNIYKKEEVLKKPGVILHIDRRF